MTWNWLQTLAVGAVLTGCVANRVPDPHYPTILDGAYAPEGEPAGEAPVLYRPVVHARYSPTSPPPGLLAPSPIPPASAGPVPAPLAYLGPAPTAATPPATAVVVQSPPSPNRPATVWVPGYWSMAGQRRLWTAGRWRPRFRSPARRARSPLRFLRALIPRVAHPRAQHRSSRLRSRGPRHHRSPQRRVRRGTRRQTRAARRR